MDAIDKAILFELSQDCRLSYSDLGRQLGVTSNTIKNRVKKLVDQNVIISFNVELNPELLNISQALVLFDVVGDQEFNGEEFGRHELVAGVGKGVSSGVAIVLYRNNQELVKATDLFQNNENLANIEVIPILLPPQARGEPPKKELTAIQPIDWMLLYHLRHNGRISLSSLSKKTKVSVKTIRKRLQFLNSQHLIRQTINLNPGSARKGIIMFAKMFYPSLNNQQYMLIDQKLTKTFPDTFWVSWRVAGLPVLLASFYVPHMDRLSSVESTLRSFEGIRNVELKIGGSLQYFPDLRDKILEEKKAEGWFSPEQWEREI